jgi:hypothetical protein
LFLRATTCEVSLLGNVAGWMGLQAIALLPGTSASWFVKHWDGYGATSVHYLGRAKAVGV